MISIYKKKTKSIQVQLSVFVIWTLFILSNTEKAILQSTIKADTKYESQHFKNINLYSVNLQRTASTDQQQDESCHSSPKQIVVKKQTEIYRLKSNSSQKRQETIFTKIRTLDDNQNIIEDFQTIGSQIFVLTTEGNGYFLPKNYTSTQNSQIIVKTGLNLSQSHEYFYNVIIIDFNERALIITPEQISICRSQHKSCSKVQNYDKVEYLFNAKLYTVDGKNFLFIVAGDMIIVYQLTANGILKDKKVYDQTFFKTDKVHIRNMEKTGKNQLLFLDSRSGLFRVVYQNDQINILKDPKLLYEQPGCYLMEEINTGDDIVLGCSLASHSFFLLKLKKSYNFVQPHYEPQQTLFTNEKIYDLTFVDNFIMSRIYSGVRMFWTSDKASIPYPFDYNHAGNIFLHNALQSKLKVINGENVIFISTEDQIRKFQLKIKHPYVWCYSTKENTEQYILTYNFPCQNATPMMKICSSSESLVFTSWEHGEVKITTMLIPLILSILGFIAIAYIGIRIYKNYHGDIERARLRYNSDNEFGL